MGRYADVERIRIAAHGLTITDEASASVEHLIAKAETRLAARIPKLHRRVERGEIDEELVAGVVEDVVIRVLRNPAGYTYEQAGEFVVRLDGERAAGAVKILDSDIAAILGEDNSPLIGSVRMRVPAWRLP